MESNSVSLHYSGKSLASAAAVGCQAEGYKFRSSASFFFFFITVTTRLTTGMNTRHQWTSKQLSILALGKKKKKKEPKNKVMIISNHFYHLGNDYTKLSGQDTVAGTWALLFFFVA